LFVCVFVCLFVLCLLACLFAPASSASGAPSRSGPPTALRCTAALPHCRPAAHLPGRLRVRRDHTRYVRVNT
jgi:hypothetical protein